VTVVKEEKDHQFRQRNEKKKWRVKDKEVMSESL